MPNAPLPCPKSQQTIIRRFNSPGQMKPGFRLRHHRSHRLQQTRVSSVDRSWRDPPDLVLSNAPLDPKSPALLKTVGRSGNAPVILPVGAPKRPATSVWLITAQSDERSDGRQAVQTFAANGAQSHKVAA